MKTKPIFKIKLDELALQQVVKNKRRELFEEQVTNVNNKLDSIMKEIQKELQESDWLQLSRNVFYNHAVAGLFPDLKHFTVGNCETFLPYKAETFKNQFAGFTGKLMTRDEYLLAFSDSWNKLRKLYSWPKMEVFTIAKTNLTLENYAISENGDTQFIWNGSIKDKYSYHIPIYRMSDMHCKKLSTAELVYNLLKYGLIPLCLSDKAKRDFGLLNSLYKTDNKIFDLGKDLIICVGARLFHLLFDHFNQNWNGLDFSDTAIESSLRANKTVEVNTPSILKSQIEILLSCDKVRADLEPYDEKILTDPNRGHWDLWRMDETQDEGDIHGLLIEPLMSRDPIADIKRDGVIGIDFGTKSTVVVFQEDSEHTMPMRIGTGQLSKQIEAHHYENPTVMEMIDFNSFMKSYLAKDGRPETSWEDLTTSHTAFESFLNSSSKDYYAYLYELKQWAGDKQRQIRLRDKNNIGVLLPSFLSLPAGTFNPVEVYAYYIGLYINNMHNGIYLDYYLSYPVTYEKEVRDKIVSSFEKGIKKSLPIDILNNPEVMSTFKVRVGMSEPVAYAVCALEKYGFDPTDAEKIFYGVFDFGGGTTDFDFGLYREANQNERRWDYVIESFGAGGDRFLGGENILDLLAFEVFTSNINALRNEAITFQLPPECKRPLGTEMLISNSQEAKLNMAQLVEKLRPFWERHQGYEKDFEQGIVKVSLYNSQGDLKPNFELVVDPKTLDKIIYERIDKGVRNFFLGLAEAFNLPYDTHKINHVNILLAGNSCKSPVVKELFTKYILEYNQILPEKDNGEAYFSIYPPLGTKESQEIQIEKGFNYSENMIENPTGKTGVAFGLIRGRHGGKIKVISERSKDEEIKFLYYIGNEKKRKFKMISNREIPYMTWYYLIDAEMEDFTIYYTSLPECIQGTLDIVSVSRKKCYIPQTHEGANVYYRATGPSTIEYVVARPQELENQIYLSDIYQLSLGGD